MIERTANAVWNGSIKEGKGKISTQSKTLYNTEYSFHSRFGAAENTNPDELLAAAHAGCYAMALSLILGKEGFTPTSLDVSAKVTLDADKLQITGSHLMLKADIPEIDKDTFEKCANAAKDGCPVSKALSLDITLDATLNEISMPRNNF